MWQGVMWSRGAGEEAMQPLADLRRGERIMLIARAIAVPWAFLQVLTYTTLPYPAGVQAAGLVIVGVLAAGTVAAFVAHRMLPSETAARRTAVAGLGLDVLVVSAFAWLFAFDQESALWAILLIVSLEGAVRFQLRGALASWTAVTVLYVGREIWGSDRYGYRLQWDSVTFRMGIGLMIALVAGLMARDLVRQRARLLKANNELRRVDAIRSALVTTLAHDVRNPLTTIRGTLTLLLSRGSLDDRFRALVQATDHSAERLERMSLGLLDLARLETGQLELKISDVPVAHAVTSAATFADPKGVVEAVVDPSLSVRADPDRFEQVLVNLIANAVRHGAPPILVAAEADGAQVRISVADAGPGVPDELRHDLFEPFKGDRRSGSVGFGLSVVKALTEAQGGRVAYYENQPRGSIFEVTLPAASGPAEQPA